MKTLLLVDNDELTRQKIRAIIKDSDVKIKEIIECNNGKTALEILKSRHIDAMLTDIIMPEMDGLTLVSEAQKLRHTPLIAVVSKSDSFEYAVEMLRNGVKEYILKPVDSEKVIAMLKKFEEILEYNKRIYIQNRKTAFQQLQYMLFYDNVTDVEIENICLFLQEFIPIEKFIVFCFGKKEEDIDLTVPNKYYFLQGQENLDIIISDIKYKEEVTKKLENHNIGISAAYYNLMDLKQAFCEAAEMRRTAFETCQEIVDAQTYISPEKEYEYGVKLMIQTSNLICSHELNDALEQLEVFVEGVKTRKYPLDEFQEQMKLIIQTTMKVYKKTLKNKEQEVLEMLNIFSYQNIDEYMEVVRQWIKGFDDLVSDTIDEYKTNAKMKKAIDYIKNNYSTNLNMAVVSNHISMNYSLFSFTFKQYTGTNFVDYLKNTRVGKAKELLTETDLKVNEVSKAVGYNHEKHFMKTFKSITGLTPSQYRNNLRS